MPVQFSQQGSKVFWLLGRRDALCCTRNNSCNTVKKQPGEASPSSPLQILPAIPRIFPTPLQNPPILFIIERSTQKAARAPNTFQN